MQKPWPGPSQAEAKPWVAALARPEVWGGQTCLKPSRSWGFQAKPGQNSTTDHCQNFQEIHSKWLLSSSLHAVLLIMFQRWAVVDKNTAQAELKCPSHKLADSTKGWPLQHRYQQGLQWEEALCRVDLATGEFYSDTSASYSLLVGSWTSSIPNKSTT